METIPTPAHYTVRRGVGWLVVVAMLLLSPIDIQYLPGLECGEENVEISQAVSLQDKQVLQATFIYNTWYCLNSSLLVVYKLLHRNKMLDKVLVEKVDKSRIPSMFIKQISKQRPGQQSLCQTGFVSKNTCDSLGSISASVTNKEERDTLVEDKLLASDDENSNESETDDEEYECVVCRLEFAEEAKFDEHRRIAQHWGCSFCSLIFFSSHLLHLHKEDANHWSDDGLEEETDSEQEEERWGEGDRML